MTIATTLPDILWHRVHPTTTATTTSTEKGFLPLPDTAAKKRDAVLVAAADDYEWASHHHHHHHHHYYKRQRVDHNKEESRHEQLVEAMWIEARDYWLLPEEAVDKDTAKRLLRGLELVSVHTQPLPLLLELPSSSNVKAAERLHLTFTLPIHRHNHHHNYHHCRQSYDWRVSWYDLFNPQTVQVAGSMRMEPFLVHNNHNNNNKCWNLEPMDHWKEECHKWLQGAGIIYPSTTTTFRLETVARLVMAGVGILARDVLASTRNINNHNMNMPFGNNNIHNNHNNMSTNSTKQQQQQQGWIFKRTMLRLERELQTWNNHNNNVNNKDPNEMEVSESIQRKGGLLSHPTVVAALRRECRWDQPVVF